MNRTLSREPAVQKRLAADVEPGAHASVDLRGMLSDLGHMLVREHGFSPAELHGCSTYVNRTTEPLVRFLVWLRHTPEAIAVLREMGVWHGHVQESPDHAALDAAAGDHTAWRGKSRTSVA